MNVKLVTKVIMVLFLILSGCAIPTSNSQTSKVETDLRFSVQQEGQFEEALGVPYEIKMGNCEGVRDSEKVEERSKTYLTELDIEVSNNVAAEIGTNVEVAKVMLSDEIGLALGVRVGTSTEAKSSVKIVTPPGYRTVAHLQWKEVWTTGIIAISFPDGTYLDALPFSVLNSLTLEQLDIQTINCDTGTELENGSEAQISTPEVPIIPATPEPVSIGTISVPGNSSEGIKFSATQAGIYSFKYVSGSYSTYPASKTPPAGTLTWLTAIRVFKNREVDWNGIAISNNSDYRAADFAYYSSASEVENIAQGSILTVALKKGEFLIFVAVDELPYYSDNPGEVIFEVLYTSSQ